jgi:hypothetical protein
MKNNFFKRKHIWVINTVAVLLLAILANFIFNIESNSSLVIDLWFLWKLLCLSVAAFCWNAAYLNIRELDNAANERREAKLCNGEIGDINEIFQKMWEDATSERKKILCQMIVALIAIGLYLLLYYVHRPDTYKCLFD